MDTPRLPASARLRRTLLLSLLSLANVLAIPVRRAETGPLHLFDDARADYDVAGGLESQQRFQSRISKLPRHVKDDWEQREMSRPRALSTSSSTDSALNDKLFDGSLEGWRLAVTTLSAFIITSLAVAAGIGGGGLLVPVYSILLDIDTKLAIPISQATIFGVACGNVLFIAQRTHPNAHRPLIDYSAVAIMLPAELAGVIIGVLLNRVLPEVIIIILLVLVLGFTAYKTIRKAAARWQAETAAAAKAKAVTARKEPTPTEQDAGAAPGKGGGKRAADPTSSTACELESTTNSSPQRENVDESTAANAAPLPAESEAREKTTANGRSRTTGDAESDCEELQRLRRTEAAQYPLDIYLALLMMTVFLILYSLLMTGSLVPSYGKCDPSYWAVYWTPLAVYGGLVFFYARKTVRLNVRKEALRYAFVEGDLHWSRRTVLLLVPAALGAGVAAGLLGIGGGMVLGPLFVALNFQPQVGAASNGFMILFTALAGVVQYLALDRLAWRYAVWFVVVGFVGGQTGQRLVQRLVRRTGRPSIVVWILGITIALAVVATAINGSFNVADENNDGQNIWEIDTTYFECDER